MGHCHIKSKLFSVLQTKLRSLITRETDKYRISWPEDCVDVFKNTFYQLKGRHRLAEWKFVKCLNLFKFHVLILIFLELEHLELAYSMAHLFLSSVSPGSVLANLKYLKINRLKYEDSDEVM